MYRFNPTLLGQKLEVMIWDTKGASIHDDNRKYVIQGSDIVLILFDVSDIESFNRIGEWISYSNNNESDAKKFLIAHKADL